jgi:hypothetical protein
MAESHWKAAESIGALSAYEDHLARFPSCAFANLARSRIAAVKEKNAVIVPAPTLSPRSTRGFFDGDWDVVIACTQLGRADSYSITLAGVVNDGVFHAERGAAGNPGRLVIDGRIALDGKATLVAKGLTGDPKLTINNQKSGSPYGYTISAKFDENSGTGKRNESRPCTVTFARH